MDRSPEAAFSGTVVDVLRHLFGQRPVSPAAQAVLFHYLLRRDESATTPSAIAECLRYSAMSIGRAFDALAAAGLAKTERHGKERHPSRLERDFGRKRWDDEGYAMEELVAELGAAFLCADLELELAARDDHAAYIASWLKVLKQDKRATFTAAAHAAARR